MKSKIHTAACCEACCVLLLNAEFAFTPSRTDPKPRVFCHVCKQWRAYTDVPLLVADEQSE